MRTIGFRSNILFAIAAAFGIIAALDRPWYAPAPAGESDTAGGQVPSSMETADRLIAGLAIATVLLLVLTLVP